MKNILDKTLNIFIIILFILLLIALLYLIFNDKVEKFDNIDNNIKLKYEITKAVNGKDLNVAELVKNNLVKNDKLKRGWYGCALSHVNIWKKALAKDDKYFLVLEDDVVITNDFVDKTNKILSELKDTHFDVLYLSSNCGGNLCKEGKYISPNIYYPYYPDNIAGMQAYIVNKNIVNKLIEKVIPINFAIDRELMDLVRDKQIISLITKDNIINVNNYNDSETERII